MAGDIHIKIKIFEMKNLLLFSFLIISFSSCEIQSTTSGCPTTAACGCSQHNKSECESDPCCKWTVGEGGDCG